MTGSLQEKNGKYYAVINLTDCNGKRKQKWISSGYEVRGNKKKAEQFLRDIISEYEQESCTALCDILFSDYINHWLDVIKISVSEVTYRGYRWISETHLMPYFTDRNIKLVNITKNILQDYFNYKYENGRKDGKGGLSPKTLKEHKVVLQLVFKEALENELIKQNPCLSVKLPSVQRREPSFYTKKQVEKMLNAFENCELYPLFYLTVSYGLRRSELLGIKWDSIDYERRMLTIKHTVVRYNGVIEKDTTKNKSSFRSYPMSDKIFNMFVELKEKEIKSKKLFGKEYIENDYVFKWDYGKPYSPDYITAKFSKLLKQHNLPHIRFHDLRHTCASLLIDSNYQLKDIQEWLGHADIQTTANIYGHIDIERKKNISNDISNMF